MLFRSIHLLALGAGVVHAQQAPLGGGGGAGCLTSTSGSRGTALSACCPTEDTEGKGTVDGTVFTYKCSRVASVRDNVPIDAASPRECAQKCAKDPSCAAGTWDGKRGRCYFTFEGVFFDTVKFSSWILIAKTEEMPSDEPAPVDPGAIAQCNSEKDAIRREMTNQCEMEVQGQKAAHQSALRQAEERCKEDKAQCEADKSRQVAAAREQCDADKAGLEHDREMCEVEKNQQIQQSAAAEDQCKSQVDDLQRQVKDLEDKVRSGSGSGSGSGTGAGSGSGSGSGTGSGTGTGSGSSSGSGSNKFVVTGNARCENLSPNAGCEPGCKKFAVDGVEYEHRCNVFAQRTRYLYGGLNQYRSISECLAYRCNKESNCLGVGWQPNGLCVFHYPVKPGMTANVVPAGGNRHNVMKVSP